MSFSRFCREAAFATALIAAPAWASVPAEVVEGLAEVRRVARHGDSLWPGFSAAPFGFLLVEKDGETLICDDRVPGGFTIGGRIGRLGCATATGPSSWRQPSLLAAMPVFGPGEIIVMGTPSTTGQDPGLWRRTILHEHFHQWQGTLPDIYERIDRLGLANSDKTGMWMLNYPFPYERPDVGKAYLAAAHALIAALRSDSAKLRVKVRNYLVARSAFEASVRDADWRYYDFQLWKEGVARWTELEIARRAGGNWAARANVDWAKLLSELSQSELARKKRSSVYAFGAAEAALLERVDPDWRGCYRAVLGLSPCWESLRLKLGSR